MVVDRARIIGIANAHGADRHDNTGRKIVEIAEQDGRQSDTYGDANSPVQIMAIDKTLIFPDIIHLFFENRSKLPHSLNIFNR
jgi:hypothetical protein